MKRTVIQVHPNLIRSEARACDFTIHCYKDDILKLYNRLENDQKKILNPIMIDNQPEIQWFMRPYLIDFLIELHIFFDLSPETLFLASSISDRYCSKRIVYKRHYQLLIATSLWIAAKYQDKKTRVPTLKELYLLCYQIYDQQMFVQMEKHILNTLEWSIGGLFTIHDSLKLVFSTTCFKNMLDSNKKFNSVRINQLTSLSSFLLDLSLYQRDYMLYDSSTRTITAILLASQILEIHDFPEFINSVLQTPATDVDNDNYNTNDPVDENTFPFEFIAGDEYYSSSFHINLKNSNLVKIRKCLLLYLNDLFGQKDTNHGKSRSSNVKNPNNNPNNKERISKVLYKKYKVLPVKDMINAFVSKNIELYLHLNKLMDSRNVLIKNGNFVQPWLNESINMFVDYFSGLQSIHYDEDDEFDGNNTANILEPPASQPFISIIEEDIQSNTITPLPVLMRSASSISTTSKTNPSSTASSRSSSVFSQSAFRSDSPRFIDTITPLSATMPVNPNFMKSKKRLSVGSFCNPSNSNMFVNPNTIFGNSSINNVNNDIPIPPTPVFTKHKPTLSFTNSTSLLFNQSPVLSATWNNNSHGNIYSLRTNSITKSNRQR